MIVNDEPTSQSSRGLGTTKSQRLKDSLSVYILYFPSTRDVPLSLRVFVAVFIVLTFRSGLNIL